MAKKEKGRRPWIFTAARKASLVKARKEHSRLIRLGKSVRTRG